MRDKPNRTRGAPVGIVARILAFRADIKRYLAGAARKRANANDGLDDQTQDVFVAVVEKQETFDEASGDPRKWAFGIATNVVHEDDREQHYRQAYFCPEDAATKSAPSPMSSPERVAHFRKLQRKVFAALKQLPPTYFEVLLLVGIQGWSQEEAAEKIGISLALTKKRLERARAFLTERTGISRDDLRFCMPLLWLVETEEATSRLERWRKRFDATNPGGNGFGAILVGLLLSTSPPADLSTARAGLTYRVPAPAFVASLVPLAPSVPDVAPSFENAKPPPPRLSAAKVRPDETPARAETTTKVDLHPSRIVIRHRTSG